MTGVSFAMRLDGSAVSARPARLPCPSPGGRARSGAPGRLTGVPTLNLARNSFTTLPAGVFSGLTALVDLTLGGNPTDPLQLTVTVEKVGTGQVRAKVLEGAPFAVAIPVTLENGALAGGATALRVAEGTEGTAVTVTRTAGTTAAVTVDVDLTPSPTLPSDHSGYEFVKATTDLPATILSEAPPSIVTNGVSVTSTVGIEPGTGARQPPSVKGDLS